MATELYYDKDEKGTSSLSQARPSMLLASV